MFYQTCIGDWKWFWIKGTPEYQRSPQIIKDPQDFHFRETFLEVCVTHVSFSCSSSPRFDQVPVKRILRMQRILGFCHVCIEEDREKCMIYTVYPIYLIPLKMQNVLKSAFFELLYSRGIEHLE